MKAILWIDHDMAQEPVEEDAWYDHQLVGLDVVRDGEKVGVLDRLEHLPAQDLLVVKVGDREVLVPFVKAIVPEVDLAGRRIVVTPPEGLFETLPDDDPRPARVQPQQDVVPEAGSDEDPAATPDDAPRD